MHVPNGHSMLKQRIRFVSGKGGVGKSMVAAALAYRSYLAGDRVLLVELGTDSFFRHFFGTADPIEPISLKTNFDLVRWDGLRCLREYILYYVRLERIVDLFFDNKIVGALVRAAPALNELSILGKTTSGIRQIGHPLAYQTIVVDGHATGHFLALLRAPVGMYEAVKFGPMGDQTKNIVSILKDSNFCSYHVVSLPEDLPTQEGLELWATIQEEFNQVPTFVFNRVWPDMQDAAKSLDDPFCKSLCRSLEVQKQKFEMAKQQVSSYKQIPFILEASPWSLIEKMEKYL